MSYPPSPGQPYGYPPPLVVPTSGKATASLVMGIASLVMCGLLLGIPAMVVAWQAKRDIKQANGALGGGGMATAGFVTGLLGTLWSILLVALVAGLLIFSSGSISTQFNESCTTTDSADGFSVECS